MHDQMYKYFDLIVSKYQSSLSQSYNTQHFILVMIEKWKEALRKGSVGAALLTDLSKAFDCVKHNLLATTLVSYGFDSHS